MISQIEMAQLAFRIDVKVLNFRTHTHAVSFMLE